MKQNDKPQLKDYAISTSQILRYHRSQWQRTQLFLKNYAWVLLLTLLIIALLMPGLIIPLALLFSFIAVMTSSVRKSLQWAWRRPIFELNKKQREALSNEDKENLGILYLGNEKEQGGKALWLSIKDLVTHVLLLGTTGSGKTQLLLSMMYQYAQLGSGFIFCDGKGDIKTWFYLYSNLRSLGLEDNLLVINFLTGGDSKTGHYTKISNTLNPFSCGSSDALMEMISGFMGSSGKGGDSSMWRGRAETLGRCLLRALCELRDQGKFELSVETIRQYLPLNKLEELAEHPCLSDFTKTNILHYLGELPAWKAYKDAEEQNGDGSKAAAHDAKITAYEQHGYLTMQFTKTLELLAGTYSHITKTDLAEVDFKDVITHRRILYIMLPSLEKSPESLKDLGRMIVTSIRNALAGLLGGDQLTGERRFLLDARPTHSDVPFGIFLDEYGSYAVEGFGDVGAQARSLNISVWFSGQEFDSFKKGSDIEAERVYSNTGIKIFMKTEGEQTAQMAQKRAGKMYAYAAKQVKINQNTLSSRTVETGNYSLEKTPRISRGDLASLKPGECFVFSGATMWRAQGFYGDFKLVEKTQINHFIKIKENALDDSCSSLATEKWQETEKKRDNPDQLTPELTQFIKKQQEQARAN